MVRSSAFLLAVAVFLGVAPSQALTDDIEAGTFLVSDRGYALLGPDGKEKERLGKASAAGRISPDGHWVTFIKAEPNLSPERQHGSLVIQSLVRREESTTVPLVWGTTGSSCLPIWSSDSMRILICEWGRNPDGIPGAEHWVYDLATKESEALNVPAGYWVSDWSADGKRLLTNARPDDDSSRLAWINVDGTGEPEFITSEEEVAYGGRLSPDGRRMLCKVGPKAPQGERSRTQLFIIDLSNDERTMVGEPGELHASCWSADGSKIAYTWQRSLDKPAEVAVRETLLITRNADGTDRKVVTSRKYEVPQNSSGRSSIILFFSVLDWR